MRSAAKVGLAVALLAGSALLATVSAAGAQAEEDGQVSFSSTCDQLRCYFEAEGTESLEGNVSRVEWTFGPNGTTETGSPVLHTFSEPGTYDVQLTVTSGEGNDTVEANATGGVTVARGEVPWIAVGFGAAALVGSVILARAT
jgi:PKD repeat protein